MLCGADIKRQDSGEERKVQICRPEPTKAVCGSCEVDEQVFRTVSDTTVDHFVGTSPFYS